MVGSPEFLEAIAPLICLPGMLPFGAISELDTRVKPVC